MGMPSEGGWPPRVGAAGVSGRFIGGSAGWLKACVSWVGLGRPAPTRAFVTLGLRFVWLGVLDILSKVLCCHGSAALKDGRP
jgi:hypothetical protein